MQIEAVSEMDSISNTGWEEIETIAQWNGRDLSTVNRKHHEDRISSIALQRAKFDNSQTGYVLCKSDSRSESRDSDDKVLSSDEDTKKSNDNESKTDVQQSLSVGAKYDSDNHGNSSNETHLTYKAKIPLKKGRFVELGGKIIHEKRRDDRCEISDRTSGEIDASCYF